MWSVSSKVLALYRMNLHIHAMQLSILLFTMHFTKVAFAESLSMNRTSLMSRDEEIASQKSQIIFPQPHKVRN